MGNCAAPQADFDDTDIGGKGACRFSEWVVRHELVTKSFYQHAGSTDKQIVTIAGRAVRTAVVVYA
jgi:hypothetical protein